MTSLPLVRDRLGRPLRSLRVSVTDRCNLRCAYCMPEPEYRWLARGDLLTFEELAALARAFVAAGARKVRITGGEPLLRRELPRLIALLAGLGLEDLALTTNGVLLAEQAAALAAAGLGRLTVSLDTLRRDRFEELTRRDDLPRVLAGIEAARAAGFGPGLKLDTVLLRGRNDDEALALLAFAREVGAELRFIEYMDVGGATGWTPEAVVGQAELLARVEAARGRPAPLDAPDRSAPAERFGLPDGQVFGVIASVTRPFCRTCDRARLTADGRLFRCLYATEGVDLRGPLRAGEDEAALARRIEDAWAAREDRGAERRHELAERGALAPADRLREDPHLEMHTRGG